MRLRSRKDVGEITLLNINIFFFVLIRFFPYGQVEGQGLRGLFVVLKINPHTISTVIEEHDWFPAKGTNYSTSAFC